MVGEVIKLTTGEKLPVDGIVIYSSKLIADESALTGEPDGVHKGYGHDESPFLISGSEI
jgi:P-type E1-E2 ATPase